MSYAGNNGSVELTADHESPKIPGAREFQSLRVSVVIPCYDEAATLPKVIRSVLAQPDVHQVIVVDDGSRDSTCLVR